MQQNVLQQMVRRVGVTPSRLIEGEGVLVATREGEAVVVNEVAYQIWQWIDGEVSLTTLVDKLCDDYDVEASEAATDIANYLHELQELKIIEFC